jgi:8-oxo-dGTP diphosphatase
MDRESRVLLQFRGPSFTYFPNHWTLPGGMVEKGESPEQAMVREVKEELGLDSQKFRLFEKVTEETSEGVVERLIFYGSISEEGKQHLILGEGSELHFFSSPEIHSLDIAFGLEKVLERFFLAVNAGQVKLCEL